MGTICGVAALVFGLSVPMAAAQTPSLPAPAGADSPGVAAQDEAAPEGEPFSSYVLVDATGAAYREPLRIERLVESLKAAPFENVIVQVRAYGDAYYESGIVPKAIGVSQELDPLGELIRGLKSGENPKRVYAWLNLYRVADVNRPVPLPPEHVLNRHPDWLSRNIEMETQDEQGRQYLEPGLEAVQDHLGDVVEEIARRYPVDGFLLEGLRYPGPEWGYDPQLVEQWRRETGSEGTPEPGDETWAEMRRDWIDTNAFLLSRRIADVNPDIDVMAVALAEGPAPDSVEDFENTAVYQGALQDWPEWLDEGIVDSVMLENFRDEATMAEEFDEWNEFAGQLTQQIAGEIVPAVAGWQNLSIDALGQIRRVQKAGLSGAVLSSYREPIRDAASRDLFFRALGKTVFAPTSVRMPYPVPDEEPIEFVTAAALPTDRPADEAADEEETQVDIPPPPELPPDAEADLPAPLPPPGQLPGVPQETGEPVETVVVDSQPEDLLAEATQRLGQERPVMIEPPTQAVQYLKTRYPNIF